MQTEKFISVILPLKLEWEPYYRTSENLEIGDRVKVLFAGKEYVAVVSGTDKSPDIDTSKVKPIISVERDIEKVLKEEIELWRQVALYYICTVGEVYKAAYPIGKINLEEARAEAEAIRDSIKAEMMEREVEELTAGQYIIRWTSVLSQRFDTTAFKKVMPEVYKAYTKQVTSRRFSIA